ncbi:MAG TPA: 50S ribosomal protein L29 [Candidatus Paceibacterota bacterium]|nr:50S ribosomal protein L29 [Candidatus Paceibacterota bacterium]
MEDLTSKSIDELAVKLKELRAKLLQIRFDLADKKLKNFNEFGAVKKDIARILTRMRQLQTDK